MPRYDFQCRNCIYTFEEERPFGDEKAPACPQCGGETLKLIAPPAIHFKGEGFYNTDSVKKEEKPKKEEDNKKTKKPKNPIQQNPNPNSNIQNSEPKS